MATRSRIGIINKGEVVADTVYCHWDGYPQYVGAVLKLYYTDVDKIKELISGGNLSSISKFIGEKHDLEKQDKYRAWCTYYKRDRGEDGVDPQWLDTSKFWGDSGEEYKYLFKVETGKRTKNRLNRKSQSTTKRISTRALTRCLMTSLLNSKN